MRSRLWPLLVAALALTAGPAAAQPQGELTYAMHVTIAPAWFDPADNTGIATPFMVQEALHDALVKPMPQSPMAPGLAGPRQGSAIPWTARSDV